MAPRVWHVHRVRLVFHDGLNSRRTARGITVVKPLLNVVRGMAVTMLLMLLLLLLLELVMGVVVVMIGSMKSLCCNLIDHVEVV